MAVVKIIGITGVSGVGKSTILSHILRYRPDICIIPTITNRPSRPGETDREHTFIASGEFDQLLADDQFAYIVQPFGIPYYYGVLRIDTKPTQPSILILRSMFIDAFRQEFPSGLLVNIEAPLEVIQQRIAGRGDDPLTTAKRLAHYDTEHRQGLALSDFSFDHSRTPTELIAKQIIQLLDT